MDNYLNLPGDDGVEDRATQNEHIASSVGKNDEIHASAVERENALDEFTKGTPFWYVTE